MFNKVKKFFEFDFKGNASYRIKPETDNLKKDDYKVGFGIDTTHYHKVQEERARLGLSLGKDFTENWDSRKGYDITGEKLPFKYHKLHDEKLINKKGEVFIIDAVYKQWFLGFYLAVAIRKEGTKSHGIRYIKNISSKCPLIIEGISEFKSEFKFKK